MIKIKIPIDLWPSEITLVISELKNEAIKELRLLYPKEDIDDVEELGLSNAGSTFFMEDSLPVLIWLNYKYIKKKLASKDLLSLFNVVNHEVIHASIQTLKVKGYDAIYTNDEPLAYLVDYLNSVILKEVLKAT